MTLAEEYIGKVSPERAIEMLEHAIGHIWRVSPDSWADSSIPLLTELCLLRALDSIRPNISKGQTSELSTVSPQKVPKFGKWIVEPRADR